MALRPFSSSGSPRPSALTWARVKREAPYWAEQSKKDRTAEVCGFVASIDWNAEFEKMLNEGKAS